VDYLLTSAREEWGILGRYMITTGRPRSQGWKTFLRNQAAQVRTHLSLDKGTSSDAMGCRWQEQSKC